MNDNLVKTLREKTEGADLDTILKTALFGYSRKSVREYVSMMRRQQYDMQRSFSEEMQLAQSERERLTQGLAEANARSDAAREALKNAKPLVEKAAGLEKDMDEAVERIQADAAKLEQLTRELEEQKEELQRVRSQRDDLLARMETAAAEQRPIEPAQAEISAESPEMNAGAAQLVERPEAMQVQLAILTRERENTAKWIESILRQEKNLFQALNECRAELEDRRDQARCMDAENKELSQRLSEQMWQNVSLNREITHIRTANENLKRRLETALEDAAKHSAPKQSQDAENVFLWNFAE